MTEVESVLVSICSSGVIAAIVSGGMNMASDARRNRREDAAIRRQVRAATSGLAKYITIARQFGFTNMPSLESSLAAVEEIAKDVSVERALTDAKSALLHEALRNCGTLIAFSRAQGIDPEQSLAFISPDERERKMFLFSQATKPTFDNLRRYFEADGAVEIVAEFDKAEQEREAVLRIRQGGVP